MRIAVVLMVAALAVAGCNTVRGLGEDATNVGEVIVNG